jgi:hypothetical protein
MIYKKSSNSYINQCVNYAPDDNFFCIFYFHGGHDDCLWSLFEYIRMIHLAYLLS